MFNWPLSLSPGKRDLGAARSYRFELSFLPSEALDLSGYLLKFKLSERRADSGRCAAFECSSFMLLVCGRASSAEREIASSLDDVVGNGVPLQVILTFRVLLARE